ncbi:MAG: hypothetical protein WB797_08480 [Nocardioides sp.]
MTLLELGVLGRSTKEIERRLPIHPEHLSRLEPEVAGRITLEHGYGERFGRTDGQLAGYVAGFASREQILERSDVVLLLEPQLDDVAALRHGQTLWGWPHCVQNTELTQIAIDHELTLIAFEAMSHWTRDDTVGLHVFHKNNELAGYCSVLHALQLTGSTGDYGRRLSAVVIGFGATARGSRDGTQRARHPRGLRADDARSRRRRVADPLRTDRPVRPRPRWRPEPRDHRPGQGLAGTLPLGSRRGTSARR